MTATNRLALFDCDGTMVDSQATICTAMANAFDHHQLPAPDHHQIRRIVGLSLQEAVRRLIPQSDDGLILEVAETYKNGFFEMRQLGHVQEPLYEGLVELLDQLDSDGWVLGVATGKSDRGLNHCLESHGLKDRFVTLQTADRHPSKPDPSMVHLAMAEAGAAAGTTVMIGDTSFDMEMGNNAGVRALGVDWGYHDMDELNAAGAHQVAATMDDLYTLLTGVEAQ